jgi:uncharacterized protein
MILFGVYRHFEAGWAAEYSMIGGRLYAECASHIRAMGWISMWVLICRAGRLDWLTLRLAGVDRMAITNYLMHSVIASLVFYGIGLGLVGKVDRVELLGLAVLIGLFQLATSHRWLQRYRFGPVEWLWRSLTYWRKQPMRRVHDKE